MRIDSYELCITVHHCLRAGIDLQVSKGHHQMNLIYFYLFIIPSASSAAHGVQWRVRDYCWCLWSV